MFRTIAYPGRRNALERVLLKSCSGAFRRTSFVAGKGVTTIFSPSIVPAKSGTLLSTVPSRHLTQFPLFASPALFFPVEGLRNWTTSHPCPVSPEGPSTAEDKLLNAKCCRLGFRVERDTAVLVPSRSRNFSLFYNSFWGSPATLADFVIFFLFFFCSTNC